MYKELTVEEADALFYAGVQFECCMDGRINPRDHWEKWVWLNTPPSMYSGDLFRVEIE